MAFPPPCDSHPAAVPGLKKTFGFSGKDGIAPAGQTVLILGGALVFVGSVSRFIEGGASMSAELFQRIVRVLGFSIPRCGPCCCATGMPPAPALRHRSALLRGAPGIGLDRGWIAHRLFSISLL
jgi:hypothetical protein